MIALINCASAKCKASHIFMEISEFTKQILFTKNNNNKTFEMKIFIQT